MLWGFSPISFPFFIPFSLTLTFLALQCMWCRPNTLRRASCGQRGICYQSKQVPSLHTVMLFFSGYKVPGGLGDRSPRPALRHSSSKPPLLFQEPFKTFPQHIFFKKNFIPNDREVIEHGKCVQIPCLIKEKKLFLEKQRRLGLSPLYLEPNSGPGEGFWWGNGLSPSSSDHLKLLLLFQTHSSGLNYTLFQLLLHLLALMWSGRQNLLALELINITAIAHEG